MTSKGNGGKNGGNGKGGDNVKHISFTAREKAKARRIRRRGNVMSNPPNPTDYLPPPPVMDAMKRAGRKPLAMDTEISLLNNWAINDSLSSAFAEGVTWLGFPYLAALVQRPEYYLLTNVIAEECCRKFIEVKSSTHGKDAQIGKCNSNKIKQLADEFKRLELRDIMRKVVVQDGCMAEHTFISTFG